MVAVFLINESQSYLFQLRDNKPDIVYPQHWGLFGGKMLAGESEIECAIRELKEELNFTPDKLQKFRTFRMTAKLGQTKKKYCVNIYSTNINQDLSELTLSEGSDFDFFSITDIQSGMLYSKRFSKKFPIIEALINYFNEYIHSINILL